MPLRPEDWGFSVGTNGELEVGGITASALASEFGTPLHVVDEAGLRRRARALRESFAAAYPGPTEVHYALKCNGTPGVVRMILEEGLYTEVGTLFEWWLVRRLGVPASEILVNGPHKGPLLSAAVREGAGLVIADGPADLAAIDRCARELGRRVRILLRINPDFVPQGMNRATATGSRRRAVFGFDLRGDELDDAWRSIGASPALQLAGFHCHAGTGIRRPDDYRRPARTLMACAAAAQRRGLSVDVLDLGGGFGVPTSREFTTMEFLVYQATGRLPNAPDPSRFPPVSRFAEVIAEEIVRGCRRSGWPLPKIVVEPGRAVVSGAGLLLVTVGSIKTRAGVIPWAITDGGAGTVAFPLFYEYHEVLHCRAPLSPRTRRYSLVGPVCHSADWIYRNKRMPELAPGDVLAVCDAGAYFLPQESNFGFPRPPVVAVADGRARLLRRRETFDDLVLRDLGWEGSRERVA